MESFMCIYCKSSTKKASVSDIIPFAFIGGKKLVLKNRVCIDCNILINKIAEENIIKGFESLRRRIGVTKRRGETLRNRYIVSYNNGTIELKSHMIKENDPSIILDKPRYFSDGQSRGVVVGPYGKVIDIASKKGHEDLVEKLEVKDTDFSVVESYSVPMRAFFSKEMRTMVAKICYEWLISISAEMNPFDDAYDHIRNSIYTNTVEENEIVDILTNPNISKGLFEDISNVKNSGFVEFVPLKLIIGDYYLFFEIKNNKLFCFFAFMGMILYRVLITTENLPPLGDNLMVSLIHKYKGRTGELVMCDPNRATWSEFSRHLSNQENYNKSEEYTQYLVEKVGELIQFRIEE